MVTLRKSAEFVGAVVATYVIWSIMDRITHPDFYEAQKIAKAEALVNPRYTK